MKKTKLYFAYGSNMLEDRLKDRVPSAVVKITGSISGHILKFNKVSTDKLKNQSGKGNIERTGNKEDVVHGVVFKFNDAEKPALDDAEGLDKGYAEKTVTVSTPEGEVEIVTYYATNTNNSLKPYDWYMVHVIKGAIEHNLPKDYIKRLEAVETIEDPNPELHDT